MQLNLNTKEWMALLLHLERRHWDDSAGLDEDELLNAVRKRMRSVVDSALKDRDVTLGDQWLSVQERKVARLEKDKQDLIGRSERLGRMKILTADDDEDAARAYPRKAPKMPKPGRKARRKR